MRWSGLVLLPFSSTLIIHNILLPAYAYSPLLHTHNHIWSTDTSIPAPSPSTRTACSPRRPVSLPILLSDLARLGTSVPRTSPSHLVFPSLPRMSRLASSISFLTTWEHRTVTCFVSLACEVSCPPLPCWPSALGFLCQSKLSGRQPDPSL
ncbi:hypothetical protein LY78DRAFT_300679 [Colletotrichum sublineola]|nr:hypothetical protein LY78DRAFT_300679 [Colletotrichum sublineola]